MTRRRPTSQEAFGWQSTSAPSSQKRCARVCLCSFNPADFAQVLPWAASPTSCRVLQAALYAGTWLHPPSGRTVADCSLFRFDKWLPACCHLRVPFSTPTMSLSRTTTGGTTSQEVSLTTWHTTHLERGVGAHHRL